MTIRLASGELYSQHVPKLWTTTVESHRHEVREAILAAVDQLVDERGLLSVTMTQIADVAGIGRATLYKYFPDVEHVLSAWHLRLVDRHLAKLTALRDGPGTPGERLRSVLSVWVQVVGRRNHPDARAASALHRDDHVRHAERRLHDLVVGLIEEAVAAGSVRSDVPASELAAYCLHALGASAELDTPGRDRLLDLVWASLRADPAPRGT